MWRRRQLSDYSTQKKWKTWGFVVVVKLTGKHNHVRSYELSYLHDGMKMWRSGDWEWVDVLTTGLHQEQLKGSGWWGDRSHWRAGEGGSSSSLRSLGKNWSEQAGDCSRCLIRTDVTQHYLPQQSVLRLEQVIFEKEGTDCMERCGTLPSDSPGCESWRTTQLCTEIIFLLHRSILWHYTHLLFVVWLLNTSIANTLTALTLLIHMAEAWL